MPEIMSAPGACVLGRGDESDDEMSGFEDDFSVGIDLPMTVETSGNVTPIPTTGELEELRSIRTKDGD